MLSASLCRADFTRYQVILDRMPFGVEAPPAPVPGLGANGKPLPPADSFTKTLKMCAVTRHALTGRLQVGLVDTATKKNYFLTVGDSEDGITLVEADYEGETALVRKGDQESRLTMSDVASMAGAGPAPGPAPMPGPGPGVGRPAFPPGMMAGQTAGGPGAGSGSGFMPSSRPAYSHGGTAGQNAGVPPPVAPRAASGATAVSSVPATATAAATPTSTAPGDRYTTERDAVMAARRAQMGVTNTLSGDALQQHIQQYQMDLIRARGAKGPPLPIQLTPEMDQQLVQEGVLPPVVP